MKVSCLIPSNGIYTKNRNWLQWVATELSKTNEVLINELTSDCNVIVSMSDSMVDSLTKFHRKHPDIPIITYIWDWFSFVDTSAGNYPDYLEFMKSSKEVWTSTDYMIKRMKKLHGLDCFKIKPCSVLEEFEGVDTKDLGYVVQASRRDPRYKRFEFFEKGCEDLGIPYESCHPSKYNREQYVNILAGCRALVVSTCEDANTALSAIEASYLKKPVLLSDIEPHKEEFGDRALYFKTDDEEDFKEKLKEITSNEPWIFNMAQRAHEMVMKNHTPQSMAEAINQRLHGE